MTFATEEHYGWTHPKGGWQGGRGWEDTDHTPRNSTYFGGGGGWHIENVWEAMDQPNEWFYDAAKQTLFLIPNATTASDDDQDSDIGGGTGAPAGEYVAVVLQTLISINGTKAAPVKDITVSPP